MKLTVERKIKTDKSTIGELFIDGVKECDTLEDKDRGLCACQGLEKVKAAKVQNETAIPTGTYMLTIDHSAHFDKDLPHILNVMGFDGVRIHSGNKAADTEGCILVGNNTAPDWVSSSREVFDKLMEKLKTGDKHILIEIK